MQATAAQEVPEARKDRRWPYLAAVAIALGIPPKQAFANADAIVVVSRILAHLPALGLHQRYADQEMIRQFGQLLTTSTDPDLQSALGTRCLSIIPTVSETDAFSGLGKWIVRNVGENQAQLFGQTLGELQKGFTDVQN